MNNIQNQDKQDNDDKNSSSSHSVLRKILQFLNNHKMDIHEKLLYLFLIFIFEAFLENFSRKHYFIGKILKPFRRTITPKRLILGFLLYTIVKYILRHVLLLFIWSWSICHFDPHFKE